MSKYDPPLPPEYPQCPFCDHALEDKGMLSFHDWVCVNPECEHSDCYCDNPIHKAEGGDIVCPDCGEAV